MFISLLFQSCFLELFLLFFDCVPNCAKPKNTENSLVLIQYFALGTFRKRTKNIKNICKNSSCFYIDFSSKIMTFSGSKSAWIFGWFFHWKWPPKVGHFQWKNHPKNKTFSEPLKNRFFLRSWSAPGQCPMTVLIFFSRFFRFLAENGCKKGSQKITRFLFLLGVLAPGTHQNRICDATSTFHRFPIDFGPHFHWFLVLLGPILGCFYAGSPFSPFPKYLPTNTDSPVSPQGCGGLRPAHTMTFGVPFFIDFSIVFKNDESVK